MANGERTLLLDGRQIEQARNVALMVGTVEKHPANPLFGEDEPWELRYDNLYPNVLYDAAKKLYRCWYNPFIVDRLTSETPPEKRAEVAYRNVDCELGLCYAESEDGLTWTKPDLNIVDYEGSTANNIVLRGVCGVGVYEDEQDADPARRFKMLYGGNWVGEWQPDVDVRFSPDGLHWGDEIRCPEAEADGDMQNNALWVPALQRYVGFTRFHRGEAFHRHPWGQRTLARMESDDFVKWTKAEVLMAGTPPYQTYTMQVFPYAGVYLALIMWFRWHSDDRVQCELAWSADTVRWERINPGIPIIPNADTEGEYDWGCVYAGQSVVVTDEGIRIYYGGSNGLHWGWRDGGLCLATLRPDGWAGYVPVGEDAEGMIMTTARTWGSQLAITADAGGGSVEVAVVDKADKVVATGRPVTGNVTDAPLEFDAPEPLAILRDELVRLKFTLRRAKLYSFLLD